MSFQKLILCGEVWTDPELRYTSSGIPCCAFKLRTIEVFPGRDGQQREDAEIHRVIVWGADAEKLAPILKREQTVIVEGRSKTRKWKSENGVEVDITEAVANPGGVRRIGGGDPAQKAPESGRTAIWDRPQKESPEKEKAAKRPSPVKPVEPKPAKVPVDLVAANAEEDLPF
jgi:single-strand DNA-binding protein